ncbi:MAG: hypothetical protein NC350_02315 [Corallococcus sp.]|nr:hypothetical protein [Corallococcus sp.]
MIQIIYGEKGTGKTKQIVDSANNSVASAKGTIVYVDKDSNRMHDLDRNIRLVDAVHYGIAGQKCLVAFIKGMLATNFDIEKIYIDGIAKIVNSDLSEMETVFEGIESIGEEFKVSFVITASCAKENLPPFVSKYIA